MDMVKFYGLLMEFIRENSQGMTVGEIRGALKRADEKLFSATNPNATPCSEAFKKLDRKKKTSA